MAGINAIKKSGGEKAFDLLNSAVLILLAAVTLSPFLYILAASLSGKQALINMEVIFWPVDFQLDNYKMVVNNDQFWQSYKITAFVIVVSTCLQIFMTVITAYPLSKRYLPGRKYFMFMVIISMVFVAPMIPAYLVVKQLHLINTVWAMIIPGAMSSFNMILCMTYFKSIPEELFEAARVDGMPEFKVLWKIAVPVSMPMIVTIILFYAVGTWNSYYAAVIYITNPKLRPLQAYLYYIVAQFSGSSGMETTTQTELSTQLTPEGLKMATILISTLPIIMIYPFIQKYFIKGVMIGSLKE